jgi:uncharacterized membrane protein
MKTLIKTMDRTSRVGERGQPIVLFTLTLPVMLGMLGLVVDLGWAYFRKEACKTAADSAAMAAAVAAYGSANLTCGSGVACQSETACPAKSRISTE